MAMTVAAGTAWLAARGVRYTGKSVTQVNRLIGQYQKQASKGLPFSREAARGHPITPEHPGRRRPRMPRQASLYQGGRTKYSRLTEPLPSPHLRQAPPPITRPHRHRRDATVPREGSVVNVPGRQRHTAYTQTGAMRILRKLAREDRDDWTYRRQHPIKGQPKLQESNIYEWRVGFDIYDCTTGQWATVYRRISGRRQPYSAGMTVHELLRRLSDDETNLEQYLLREAMSGDPANSNPHIRRPLTHICAYIIYASKPQGSTIVR